MKLNRRLAAAAALSMLSIASLPALAQGTVLKVVRALDEQENR